jgi:hypothetical protein
MAMRARVKSKTLFVLFLAIFFSACRTEHEAFVEKVNKLIESHKYEQALDLLQSRLESKRESDEVISRTKPRRERTIRMSQDRNRIVWSEDKNIIFRDVANPMVKTKSMEESPYEFRISGNAVFALASFRLKNTKGCRMKAISMMDDELDYDSGAHIACRNSGGISQDGSTIYYFIDENLYKENTTDPKKPRKIIDSSKIIPPYPKLRNKYSLIPVDENFLLLTGVAGSYNLYFFNTKTESLDLITKDIISPKAFYAHGSSLFVIGGKVGSWLLREVSYSGDKKPKITTGFSISIREINPWKMTGKNDFLSYHNNAVFQWGPMVPRKEYPILCERAWGIARDMFVYENKDGELVLSNTAYSEEELLVFDLYKSVKKETK